MSETVNTPTPVALITGGSEGLGLALTSALLGRGWQVVTDGRDAARLTAAVASLSGQITALQGDVRDPGHRDDLTDAVRRLGRLDLLVHNASSLGRTPLPHLEDTTGTELHDVLDINLVVPLEITQSLLPLLTASNGVLVSITSDAAIEHYEGWGAYGASKAALDHLTLTIGEETGVRAYAVDPGDMRTRMQQDAFPGEDISDRPLPTSVVPRLLNLLDARPPSGRYRATDFDHEPAGSRK
jgi:NAD(P)-dependent dehydrogenase (short-subunit alcohol dehydrogenase family)